MNISFKYVTDTTDAERLWKSFSPKLTIYDDWYFRACFHKYHQQEIRFLVGYQNDEEIGLLPLQFNKQNKYLEFFGGDYMEDNRAMIKNGYEKFIPHFYEQINEKANLEYIRANDSWTSSLKVKDYKYVLPLTDYKNANDYLERRFVSNTKVKRSIKSRMRFFTEKTKINTIYDNLNDFEQLIEYNKLMFGDHSSFNDRPFHKEIFLDLMKSSSFSTHIVSFVVDKKTEGVSLSFLYNKSYANVIVGINPEGPNNLATFCKMTVIDQAISLGAKEVDAFTGNYGWKETWLFEKIPQYCYYVN